MKSEIDKKKLIIRYAKKLNSTNLSPLRSGNISIRHARNKEHGFLITPSGMKYGDLKIPDIVFVNLQGKFRPELREFAGKYVKNEYYDDGQAPEKSVDVELAIKLKIENK